MPTELCLSRRSCLAGGIVGLMALAIPDPGLAQSPPLPLADRLARYAATLRWEDVDPGTLEALHIHLVDTFGCALGAQDDDVVRRAYAIAGTGQGPAALIGTGTRTSAELAAFANGAAIRSADLNDGYAGKEIGHPSDLVAATLAVAQAERRSARDFLVATLLAYEIECRLFDAAAISPRGWDHPTYTPAAAALAAGVLMRLPVEQLTQAVNLALVNHVAMDQTRVQVISAWKGLADADATRAGLFAARMARAGITGPAPIFEGEQGFAKLIAGEPMVVDTDTFGGRGGSFRLHDCLIKPFPAQGHTLTAVAAAIALGRRVPDKTRIASVAVATTKPGLTITGDRGKWNPTTRETADHSMPYVVARALLDGEITPRSYTPERLVDPVGRALMTKIKVVEDPAITARLPRQLGNRVTVVLADGTSMTEAVDDLPGSAGRPLSRADAEAKFWRTAGASIPHVQGERLLAGLWTIDTATNVDAILAATVTGGEHR